MQSVTNTFGPRDNTKDQRYFGAINRSLALGIVLSCFIAIGLLALAVTRLHGSGNTSGQLNAAAPVQPTSPKMPQRAANYDVTAWPHP